MTGLQRALRRKRKQADTYPCAGSWLWKRTRKTSCKTSIGTSYMAVVLRVFCCPIRLTIECLHSRSIHSVCDGFGYCSQSAAEDMTADYLNKKETAFQRPRASPH